LGKIFSGSPGAGEFYDEFFKEKVNTNLQDIGKIFQLYVQIFNKDTGHYSTSFFESKKDPAGSDFFRIPISGNAANNIITYHLIATNPLELVTAGFDQVEKTSTRDKFTRRTAAFFNTFTLAQGTLQAEFIDPNTGATFYANNSRQDPSDAFNRISCIGGIVEENQAPIRNSNSHRIRDLSNVYSPDDGECIVSWESQESLQDNVGSSPHIDFFVLTAKVNGTEFPISAHPFIGFNKKYKIRTISFLGAASNVIFRVYTVYNDFSIQKNTDTTTAIIKDIRKTI